jgi:hypothetical protein
MVLSVLANPAVRIAHQCVVGGAANRAHNKLGDVEVILTVPRR